MVVPQYTNLHVLPALTEEYRKKCIDIPDTKERIPVGTVILYRVNDQVGKLGRMVVLSGVRGMSIGRKLVSALQEAAKAQGIKDIYLEGQVNKRGFYQKVGFQVEKEDEEPFPARSTSHYKMWMRSVS
ncbi:hypothetical protein BDA99DRAFT_565012 [Phascolomyces articulosus]|uniref:N-acetyltransferase domain-containing protein n=1 Tax=Phascolomyces articulosus TaxID=60185 RepID=A0AAD5P8H9_9FUNG|nr:hypothetical protein BDA99DRAFT_565012 [Phascolomyces articulosus]